MYALERIMELLRFILVHKNELTSWTKSSTCRGNSVNQGRKKWKSMAM
jgi:hypothetical protein